MSALELNGHSCKGQAVRYIIDVELDQSGKASKGDTVADQEDKARRLGNVDELVEAIEADTRRDALELARDGLTKMTVVDYARARGMRPQLVFYHIRVKHVTTELCLCGRKVIDVVQADEFFGFNDSDDGGADDD